MDSKTQMILHFINDEDTEEVHTSSKAIPCEFQIMPKDFVRFAELDLKNNYEHSEINSISNSKRAIDCQLDLLLISFGFYGLSCAKQWRFPRKLELINEVGVLAPRILKKINKQRNLLEHKYIRPTLEQVEDYLDIANLFIAGTEKYALYHVSYFELTNKKLNIRNSFSFDPASCEIVVAQFSIIDLISKYNFQKKRVQDREPLITNIWKQEDADFLAMLRLFIERLE